jgi:hypothetical protein
MMSGVRVDTLEEVDDLLDLVTRFRELAKEIIDVLDHLEIELLIVYAGFFVDFVLFYYGLHEIPDLLLHVLWRVRDIITLTWIVIV